MSDAPRAIFLSYASQDAAAAKRICDALRAAGVEVWFDQNELVGGDAWDAKIRGQIGSCALFVPIISANTQARREGYFRLEWKLAAQRTHMMSDDTPFLLPIVIDDTRDADARVPVEFKNVQWTRLPGGETTPSFCARVSRLLTGEAAAPSASPAAAAPSTAPTARKFTRLGYLWAVVGVGFGIFYATRIFWSDRRERPARSEAVPTQSTLTEAQRLVAKAREILEQGDEMNREGYALAEDLLKRAEAADVTEASAWSLHAWLSADVYRYGLDRNEARLAQIQAQASRAASLAPNSLDAQLAVLRAQTAARAAPEDIAKRQTELAEKYPDDPRVYRLFGLSHAKDSVTFKMLERGLARWPDDPRLQGDMLNSLLLGGRFVEANEMAERFTRGRTGARVLAAQVFLQLWWQGDAAAAAASVARWPSWFLLEDRGAGMAAITALMNRTPENALELLRRFPRDYIRDSFYTGPRSALIAWASEAAGQAESAEAEWRVALQVCERELAAVPNDGSALHWKAWALARLGQKAEAQQIYRVLLQRRVAIEGSAQVTGGLAGLALVLGDPEEALREIGRLGTYDAQRTRPPSQGVFDLNPLFDPIRRDPRFRAIRDAAPAPTSAAPAGPAKAEEKSVAVLAFANLSDDKANEYFSDGISEELLNVLAKVPGLKVSARTSAFHFKGKDTPIADIAKQLGVAYVVEGSVRKAGDKVRITAQLIKAADGFHVWSDTFTRDLKDVFAVQDEIAGLVANQLSLKLGAGATAATVSVNPDAFELYARARQAWNRRGAADLDQAEELLNRALALDRGFARAHAALADVWASRASQNGNSGRFGQRGSAENARLMAKANEALSLDPSSADAYAALGGIQWQNWDFAAAERSLRHAIALNPSHASAWQWLGRVLESEGRLADAIAALRTAVEVDPLSPIVISNLATRLANVGRYTEAIVLADRALALQPDSTNSRLAKANALIGLNRKADAVDLIRIQTADGSIISRNSARILAATGDTAGADRILAQPGALGAPAAAALLELGRRAEALAALDPATMPVTYIGTMLTIASLDPIRDTPEFKRFLAAVGLTEAHVRVQAWRAAHPPETPQASK